MKDLKKYEQYRVYDGSDLLNIIFGQYDMLESQKAYVFSKEKGDYYIQTLQTFGWDHISLVVRTYYNGKRVERIPGTSELEEVCEMFFGEDEPVVEVHPRREDYVNINPYTLHLWRPINEELPLPPVVTEFSESDIIELGSSGLSLRALTARSEDGWECYEVHVMKDGKTVRRRPTWDEMCVAKKAICGEEEFALQYHLKGDGCSAYGTRLWLPPKNLDFPLPEPFMVGIRNEEDRKRLEFCSRFDL